MPIASRNHRNTRIVFGCAETPIEKSKCLKILTCSNYKGRQTAKFDVGVAPSGLVTHISQAYGGRASDKLIVNDSGILDKLIYNDAVMTDKGFKIEQECLLRNLILHRPPFVYQKKQMMRAEALKCAEIARARVHVERVIQRLRDFQFLCDPIPWEFLPFLDILIIAAAMENLGPPVLNVDKFM
ncbi:LOW QUALITY PROTEIN: 3-oxoacyl-[acyl-carrier-protein] synthase 3 protein 2 [Frankliniella fusca]|uniref:3-oxoacyl-[acyl-carrier-protein] synthase 3 protein 2 n=1 Tax=Frankliniella fusca TaxID=407009 RepID=A0AAE1HKF1_9NEOP|nr:LOW QUALITY PROTEIN: 3-oxoacyl-[acyl-carrier-protein] synthase 3 protein 2 [Frankliniella fusca]